MAGFVFYIFSALLVLAALMVISLRNTVHSVLFLIFAFFNAAALFILLGAEFIAMTLIIVYVGAVAVLFLFVVMMLNINITQVRQGFAKNLPLAITLSLILAGLFFLAITNSIAMLPTPAGEMSSQITNTEMIGLVLYTNYFYVFQVAGIILLVAMVGAIVLTLTHSKNVKRQDIMKQVMRTKEESVELVEVEVGKGVKI
jgi:NADH-quinone oxidoreductase subunit J